ncbi:MAG: GTP pyrophosphokinase family protein [Cellulomonadaceae bacterium]|nr:GTP pyrophosphokinase family protein [Cellulomonadaceae bacterium]
MKEHTRRGSVVPGVFSRERHLYGVAPVIALHSHDDLTPSGAFAADASLAYSKDPEMTALVDDLRRMMLLSKFGMDVVMTKVSILRDEFRVIHDYNPIEHITSRIKSFESIVSKARRRNIQLNAETLAADLTDIAGVRIICSFVSDIYKIRDILVSSADLTLVEENDYVGSPKESGYKSLHLIVEVPVQLSDRVQPVPVEIQLRTVAMDFWASLEHKIQYRWGQKVPSHLAHSLKSASDVAANLDRSMELIHEEVNSAMVVDSCPQRHNAPLTPSEALEAFMSIAAVDEAA